MPEAEPAASTVALCRLEEIEDGEGKGFVLGAGSERREIVVVREGERVYGYLNACPHVGTPLDFQPDRFMNADGSYLLCHTHGALFEIETGYCIAGPCAGRSLTPVALELGSDRIVRLPA
ncbi:Ferredoxin subunit of nitrite reductase or a ring-hydroxylating dioxygenase [Tistlia consotensis]|uniref:Ferredoxin subunit of nitrite reductase or a ring-hydroxylating dioxygenase n=1 Tax=Tistlia consotensis USBA 355 TaxID=560819 RepID=A0A1Y6CMQ7_9PROT|nr:Rieske 2Fe-2S domain-containing protein [Tistlia consotensis]SMF78211.1 Ferredoxin subunit of nitrite reductase or a ring-hydroxylating dioxygenase [Tistlia consotensis USBA 355]SNS18071.1 Ferredoxin subunit of nitrite reductase or a ring-hydroxylating dioxygenase [Tistlia consotensis]